MGTTYSPHMGSSRDLSVKHCQNVFPYVCGVEPLTLVPQPVEEKIPMSQYSSVEHEAILSDYLDGIADYWHLITTADKYAEKMRKEYDVLADQKLPNTQAFYNALNPDTDQYLDGLQQTLTVQHDLDTLLSAVTKMQAYADEARRKYTALRNAREEARIWTEDTAIGDSVVMPLYGTLQEVEELYKDWCKSMESNESQ